MTKGEEFDRQVQNLLQKGYPQAANLSEDELLKFAIPLKEKVKTQATFEADLCKGTLPFVMVVTSKLVPAETMMSRVLREGKPGNTKLFPLATTDFTTIPDVQIPRTPVYLLTDIDRGKGTLNVRPKDALKTITAANRSPLTIDEGIAILTQFPEFLMKNNCFSLLASRHPGDQRVPAIWINGEKRPHLGWCWDGNPHTWLGSASCANRIGELT